MQGALGIGANLNKWTDAGFRDSPPDMIALYKRIRPTVQTGDLYRLVLAAHRATSRRTSTSPPTANRRCCSPSAIASSTTPPRPPIRLRGLDEKALYKVEATDGKVSRPAQWSGAYLMRVGLNVNLRADYDAAAIVLDRL